MLSVTAVAFAVLALAPAPYGAGEECQGLPGRIYEIERGRPGKAEAGAMLELIGQAEACIEAGRLDDDGNRLTVWLLNNKVLGLDKAGRYEEAAHHVERFFAAFAGSADSAFVARMHAWRIHVAARRGRVHEGMAAYAEAIPYQRSLPAVSRARLDLDGAYLYLRLHQRAFAQAKAEGAERALLALQQAEPGEVGTGSAIAFELARAWHLQAEAVLVRDPARARALLWKAATVVAASERAQALAMIGETYAAEGDGEGAHRYYAEALALARSHGDHRGEVLALYLTGAAYAEGGRLDQAEASLRAARAAGQAHAVGAYEADALLALGDVYERQGHARAALAAYRSAAHAAKDGAAFGDASEQLALERAQEAALRLASVGGGRGATSGIAVALLVILLAGAAAGVRERIARRPAGRVADGAAPPRTPHGPSPELEVHAAAVPGGARQAATPETDSLPEPPEDALADLSEAFAEACDRYVAVCRQRGQSPRGIPGWEGEVFEKALELRFGKEIWPWLLAQQVRDVGESERGEL